ncbi:putative uncharacterized protein DDB_G0292438 [Drosophila innubila]|uniref:putative uncharacterized protein DDB_G0292438 n=1 Tax=Drosophila innubila TaxID=198719 RepID=UPI00148DDC1F|nr:putative uncharacterized protein DDB_G0292438 [Drosophila innubila]
MGRSFNANADVDVDAAADVGSGRDLFKKFLLWRGLFPQQPARDNVIVISPTTTTTTTTTTITRPNNTRPGGRWPPRGRADVLEDLPVPTMPTSLMLDNNRVQRVTKNRRRQRPNFNSNSNANSNSNGNPSFVKLHKGDDDEDENENENENENEEQHKDDKNLPILSFCKSFLGAKAGVEARSSLA